MWPIKLLLVLIRKEVFLKPEARQAANVIRAGLEASGFTLRAMMISLGLAEAKGLSLDIILYDDQELDRFRGAGLLASITHNFQSELRGQGYPANAIALVGVNAHSEEGILRAGGCRDYFH